ncbi:MAG: hypothetical protein KDH96_06085 [Candidatus Riesia sp.]|nr:hypothetical protein [Candidatus Riesia sp.]
MDSNAVLYKLFNDGVIQIDYNYDINNIVDNSVYDVDEVEPDIERMICSLTDEQHIIDQFLPIIKQYDFIWGKNPKLSLFIQRKCHFKSLEFHTDYYDRQSDFFLLFYPKEWDNDKGGQICFGIQDTFGNVMVNEIYFLATDLVLIVNNVNPLFKHSVMPCNDDKNRYLGCLEITRGTF